MLILENPKNDAQILLIGVNRYKHQLFFGAKKKTTEKSDQLSEAVVQRMERQFETDRLSTIRGSVV